MAALATVLALAAPAIAGADYGAIAVNPNTGASGVSFNYNKKGPALRRAQRECPDNCRIVVWVRNQCGAVVATQTRFVPGVGLMPLLSEAMKPVSARSAMAAVTLLNPPPPSGA